jgi:hypothetical protein
MVGFGFTLTDAIAVLEQELVEPVTVYEVEDAGETTRGLVVVPVLQV